MRDDSSPARRDLPDEERYDLCGQVIPPGYRVIDRVGKGGMGRVYKAVDVRLKRFVAIKVIAAPIFLDLDVLARFEREMQALASLNHPNIAQIYAAGRHDGVPFYVMELIEGGSLHDLLVRGERPAGRRCMAWLAAAAEALGAAFEQGLVHRDVKPSNLMLDASGRLKIVDFGIVRRLDEESSLTGTSGVIGTPLYMSPEQALGGAADHRSDIYSLGATFYHLLAGLPPFRAADPAEIRRQHLSTPPAPLRQLRPQTPPAVEAIIHKMLAKRPEDRYASYPELLEDLVRAERRSPPLHAPAVRASAPESVAPGSVAPAFVPPASATPGSGTAGSTAPGSTPPGSPPSVYQPPGPSPPASAAPERGLLPNGAYLLLGFVLAMALVVFVGLRSGEKKTESTAESATGAATRLPAAGAIASLLSGESQEIYDEAVDMSTRAKSLANMRRITTMVEVHLAERGELPVSLETLADEYDLHPMARVDGWNREIVLEPLTPPHYRVISLGADGRRGTGDDLVIEDGFVVQGAPKPPSWMPQPPMPTPQPARGLQEEPFDTPSEDPFDVPSEELFDDPPPDPFDDLPRR